MRIICLISSLRTGGAERQMAGLAEMLSEAGHKVTLVTYNDGDFYADELQGAGVGMMRVRGSNSLDKIHSIAKYAKDTGCELMISFLTGANIKAIAAHRVYGGFKLIVSERNFSVHFTIWDRARMLLFREAEAIVCNNHSQFMLIRDKVHAVADKTCVIPNFVDPDRFHPEMRPSHERKFRIVTTARLCRRKNAAGLIEAISILGERGLEVRLDWYGMDKDDRYCRRCKKLIERYALQDTVHFHPSCRNVSESYADADIFCLPSFYEGTSNSLAEALASGLPAACSRVSDNPLYVKDGLNGRLFDPHKPEDIADAISYLMSLGESELEEYGKKSKEAVSKALSRERFKLDWLELVGKVNQ